eukprot:4845367-Lingulodinium_polyedra.AAC.1
MPVQADAHFERVGDPFGVADELGEFQVEAALFFVEADSVGAAEQSVSQDDWEAAGWVPFAWSPDRRALWPSEAE